MTILMGFNIHIKHRDICYVGVPGFPPEIFEKQTPEVPFPMRVGA
jgi:hypothetical protein